MWDPHSMKSLLRINQLHKFIGFYFENGDVADKALILHAQGIAQNRGFLQKELNITSVDGVSIKDFTNYVKKTPERVMTKLISPKSCSEKI